jgi:glycosyltransferase involved in cell wall biosynthesis
MAAPPVALVASPRVSVLLPVWNARGTVARAVASIRAQTFTDWELVVVDDGSTDGTTDVLRDCAAADRRICLISRPHAGIVAALNAGLAAARGGLIARMDADDESHPERLAEQAAFLESARHRDVGLVGCLVRFGGDPVANAGYALHVEWLNTLVTSDQIALNRFVESPFAHPSVMFRRKLVDGLGAYREGDFPEDYELWLRWMDAGVPMAKVPRLLLTWHDPPARLSRTDGRYAPEKFFCVKAEWIARWLRRKFAAEAARRPIFVWGAGRPTRKRAAFLAAQGISIAGYVDIDPKKVGRAIAGTPVMRVDDLPGPSAAFVLGYVSTRGARELIRAALQARGFVEGGDFLMCA